MPDLQLQGSVPEGTATLHAFSATNAKRFINGIFKKWIFDKFSFDGICRAKLVFGSSIQYFGFRLEITAAQIAVTAHGINMDTFNRRGSQNTVCSATPALNAFCRIQLPYQLPIDGVFCDKCSNPAYSNYNGGPRSGCKEFPPVDFLVISRFFHVVCCNYQTVLFQGDACLPPANCKCLNHGNCRRQSFAGIHLQLPAGGSVPR
jgi:hypothetical protein